MKTPSSLVLLVIAASASAADLPSTGFLEPSLHVSVGFDSNPVGAHGTSAIAWGERDTMVTAASAGFGYGWSAATGAKPALKLTYAGEAVRYDRWSSEDYSTHRLGLSGQVTTGAWKFTADGSSLFVDGSRDTLLSEATINANALPLARERRRQWQHRLKLQTQAQFGAWVVRGTGSWLDYDYQTNVVAGHIAYTDRADDQIGTDLGWKQSERSFWFIGARAGRQTQAIVPLLNCEFEYSNQYRRLAAGWEGQPSANTTLSVAAGPDYRHYSGAIDPRVMLGGRDRTSLWLEGSFVVRFTPNVSLTGKAARMDWLSSTGKSAYIDSVAETALSLKLTRALDLRLTAKLHRCDYFPAYRDDWESLLGAGFTLRITDRATIGVDVLGHRAWNHLTAVPGREFQRFVANFGATIKL